MLLGLFTQALEGDIHAHNRIQELRGIVAEGRKLSDEMREKEGVKAFKEIVSSLDC